MSFIAIRSVEPIPMFDGNDYPFWKDKMMRNILSVDPEAWRIIKDGVVVLDKDSPTENEKKLLLLDKQVWVFIMNHMVRDQYERVKTIETAKELWDYMEKIGEGVSTQKDARIDTLRSKFHRFKRHEGENVMSTFYRLCSLSGELKSLGATDITDIMVVRTLLRSLDDSFAHLVMMIKERPDFRNLKPADIIERLKLMK